MSEIDPYPHAPIAEKSVLCAIIRNPSLLAKASAEGIDESAFHLPAHKEILAALKKARDAGHVTQSGEIDVSILIQEAQMSGMLERMGGPSAIAQLMTYTPNDHGWSTWCEQMRECKARRIARDAAGSISEANDSEGAIKAAVEALEAMRKAVSAKTRAIPAKQAGKDFIDRYIANMNAGEIPGTSTGIHEIDEVTGGMRQGELWTIGGKSSSGKSVFMFQIAAEFVASGRPVAVFSLELMPHEVVGRIVTLHARVPHDCITNPRTAKKHELDKIRTAVTKIGESRLWIDASAGQTLDSISSEAERIRDIEGDVALIVVDYLQIITGQRQRNESREQEIARISGGLKQLAKKLECPIITGSQLNAQGETRESRSIEQDSDALLLIEDGGILLKKIRNGQKGETIKLTLDGSAQRFRRFVTE